MKHQYISWEVYSCGEGGSGGGSLLPPDLAPFSLSFSAPAPVKAVPVAEAAGAGPPPTAPVPAVARGRAAPGKLLKAGAAGARACLIPEGWELADDEIAFAVGKGIARGAVDGVFARFRLHHRAKGTRLVDWRAAWELWVVSENRFAPRGGGAGRAAPGPGEVSAGMTWKSVLDPADPVLLPGGTRWDRPPPPPPAPAYDFEGEAEEAQGA